MPEFEFPKNHGKTWTVDHMWKLVTLYQQEKPRLTWTSIAQKLGRTVSACQARLFVIRLAFTLQKSMNADKLMDTLSDSPIRHSK